MGQATSLPHFPQAIVQDDYLLGEFYLDQSSEFLSTVHYFLGDYSETIRLRRHAIDCIGTGAPEIHEMWGHLGDAYRHNADQAARAYYYTVLRDLDASTVTPGIDREIAQSLERIDGEQFEATAYRRMAQTWLLQGNLDRAQANFDLATAKCLGYGRIADLKQLARLDR